jgi:hypothetical protein
MAFRETKNLEHVAYLQRFLMERTNLRELCEREGYRKIEGLYSKSLIDSRSDNFKGA